MSRRRVYAKCDSQAGVYHVTSRIVDRQFLLRDEERDTFVRMMRAFEAFHHVQVLTYCVMSNHFHILVRVPDRPPGFDLSAEQVMSFLAPAVGEKWRRLLRKQWQAMKRNGCREAMERWRIGTMARMFCLTDFVKSLKQRFTQYYNRKHQREGVLWERRYSSVIVEDVSLALRTIATYVDLNPVRAGLTTDPANYRWCGYGEAMRRSRPAICALAVVTSVHRPEMDSSGLQRNGRGFDRAELRAIAIYRSLLGLAGREVRSSDGQVVRRGIDERLVKRWNPERGVDLEAVRHRIIHFTRGVIVGSRRYVNEWFQWNRSWFGGQSAQKRKSGARAIRGPISVPGLFSVRDLSRSIRS